jgi:hypothetical protein
LDLGDAPDFQEMICFKILSAMPYKYDQIQQQLFQMPRSKLTIDRIKSKFATEDSRTKANRLINNGNFNNGNNNTNNCNRNNVNNQKKEESNAVIERKCKTCQKPMPKNTIPFHFNCDECHKKNIAAGNYPPRNRDKTPRQNSREEPKKKDNYNNPKKESTNVILAMSLSNNDSKSTSNTWHLDSGCTTHVSMNNDNFINLQPSNSIIAGPSGEIVPATQQGTAIFQTTKNTIQFKDTLVVPGLNKNLLSVRKITATDPNYHVIFNGTKCEIFKGKIIKKGQTLIQVIFMQCLI